MTVWNILRHNRNYRYMWLGQIVSDIGDHFNTIAVLSLALHVTGTGAAVGGVMIARALPAILAAPAAGIVLDRLDRRKVMIASDLARAAIALLFVLAPTYQAQWLLFLLSGMLMFASPFFTSGRSAILPKLTNPEELLAANSLTQTTAWVTLTLGTMLGGLSTGHFGYDTAFILNSLSFLFSAFAIWKLRAPAGFFEPERREVQAHDAERLRFWTDFRQSLGYIRRTPLILAILLAGAGWATGGGAAQILFTLFGQMVYQRGPAGTGLIWGFAGVGLVIGGVIGHQFTKKLAYSQYIHGVWINFLIHGLAYVCFSMSELREGIVFILISRIAMGTNNVQNRAMLLTHVPDALRGRVFSTAEAINNATMMVSMSLASIATLHYSPRSIGFVAGILSTSTALPWAWAAFSGRLPEPPRRLAEERISETPVTRA